MAPNATHPTNSEQNLLMKVCDLLQGERVLVGNGENQQEFRVIGTLLAICSPYFADAFFGSEDDGHDDANSKSAVEMDEPIERGSPVVELPTVDPLGLE